MTTFAMTSQATIAGEQRFRSGIIPLVIAVTGHRDLVDSEIPEIRARVTELFKELRRRFPDQPLRILSPLAEGADRLVAEVALELEIKVTLVLPMPMDAYRIDFEHQDSVDEFDNARLRADEVYELPVLDGSSMELLMTSAEHRNRQYAQLGVFLCAHSHILLAIWDGKPSQHIGSTAQVVYFHRYDTMDGYSSPDVVDQTALADDDSDLVYQIVVSRNRKDGAPQPGLRPLESFWLTGNDDTPRTDDIPENYQRIFARTGDFNRDIKTFARRIATESTPLVKDGADFALPLSILRVSGAFCAADWLAVHYQQRFRKALIYSHSSIFVMALMVLFYEDVAASRLLMLVFAVFLALAFSVHWIATRGRWHGKYLEYRTLAEGLRVQFYWAAAGVTRSNVTKFAHDNFLQKQDPELGWIRNVMREVGTACDVDPHQDADALAFVLDDWIGEEQQSGQLSYYRSRASHHFMRSVRFDNLGGVLGFIVMILLIGAVFAPTEDTRAILFVVLGIVLLVISVRNAYAFRIAEKEVVRQYEFMYRIFHNAKRRLQRAPTDVARRRILRALGEAALDEHAEWILLHRDRPLSDGQLWRL